MKVSPESDYPVQVVLESEEQDNELFGGIFEVILNHEVTVYFVPDVSRHAPPWDKHWLPANSRPVATLEQARISSVLLAMYAVTPNPVRAGAEERFELPADGERPALDGVVFYVTGEEFDRYAAELSRLNEIVWEPFPEQQASELREYEVVRFLEQRIVGSGLLRQRDVMLLGRGGEPAQA